MGIPQIILISTVDTLLYEVKKDQSFNSLVATANRSQPVGSKTSGNQSCRGNWTDVDWSQHVRSSFEHFEK
jgi:hypothetical protein